MQLNMEFWAGSLLGCSVGVALVLGMMALLYRGKKKVAVGSTPPPAQWREVARAEATGTRGLGAWRYKVTGFFVLERLGTDGPYRAFFSDLEEREPVNVDFVLHDFIKKGLYEPDAAANV